MSLITFKKVLSCSSQHRVHCAENLLKSDQEKKWLSSKGTEDRITCILELETPSFISSIDIGNDGSAYIELFVSRSSSTKADDWTTLLPSTILMTPTESRSNTNRCQMKSFKSSDLNGACLKEKWNRLKIICEQKFNRTNQFGLNFIKLYFDEGNQTGVEKKSSIDIDDEIEQEQKKVGSLFAKKQLERKSKLMSNDEQNDKSQMMKNIVFVLSGFKNPLRSELRNKATEMGAKYSDDWDVNCTHLISAFPNTPKFTQVQQAKNGFIVNHQWILDCSEQKKLLPEKSYEFKETKKRKTKEENDESFEIKDAKKKMPGRKKLSTKKEDEINQLKMGELPDFFHDKHFYVSYGDYDDNTLLDITRVILAYDGVLERQITSDVSYVITNRMWNQDFDKISKSNPEISFVSLDWLQDCHDANQFVAIQPYLIVP